MSEVVDALLSLRLEDLFVLVGQVIDNPLANLEASLLLLIAVVVTTLLAIVIAILVIGFHDADEDERNVGELHGRLDEGDSQSIADEVTEPIADGHLSRANEDPVCERLDRWWHAATTALFFLGALAFAWLLAGVTTGSDAMCLSCHGADMPHVDRLSEQGSTDPHWQTGCVRCHEAGGWLAGVTLLVPVRAVHFAEGAVGLGDASGYGVPISARACLQCHRSDIQQVTANDARGIRMSHAEPLEAGALCMDCHELQRVTGVVGAYTIGMSPCLRCHDNQQASAECESCHFKDIGFAAHVNFDPRPNRLVPDTRCGSCHDQTQCDACHGIRMPHTPEFLSAGHPREATLDIWYNDGQTCKRCHTSTRNPCTSCHRKIGPGHPVSHWPSTHGLGGPDVGSTGCNCHSYLAPIRNRNFCGVCHEEYVNYTPSR